jgi:3-oxoacyl-[acyl-carrier-protein] synthase II
LAGAQQLAAQATSEALSQARLWNGHALLAEPDRIGSWVSASKPLQIDRDWAAPDAIGSYIALRFSVTGPRRNVIAACATGAYAIALAASAVREGAVDVAIAGSVEPGLHPLMAAGFRQLGVLSRETVMRPFSKNRSGFVAGEGAGVLVLEAADHAYARGATPLAELTGWAMGADGHSPVAFNSNGHRIANVIRLALQRGGLSADSVDHLNAHGTATTLNDRLETQAIEDAFGLHAAGLKISATKSSTGHLLGAAGAVEAGLTVLALQHQFVPPTRHLAQADPDCRLDYTRDVGRREAIRHAMSISFGFGGSIGALLFSRS